MLEPVDVADLHFMKKAPQELENISRPYSSGPFKVILVIIVGAALCGLGYLINEHLQKNINYAFQERRRRENIPNGEGLI